MIVSWMTTNKCNLTCKHCYQDACPDACANELTTDEARTLIDQIAAAGFKIMIFSGGEPLMRPDIYDLVAYAASKGLRPVFGTNGTLITPEVAGRLTECGACAMGISLDSLDRAKHDSFRGLEGAWDATVAGMRACREVGLPFQIHTTVLDWNEHEVCDITDFAVEHGAIAHYIFFLIPVGRGKYINDTSLKVAANERLLRQIMAKQAEVSIDVKPTCAPQFTRVAEQDAFRARLPGGSHVLHCEPRGCRAPVRLYDRGGRQRARAALRRNLEDEPGVRAPAHARVRRLLRHVRLPRRLRRVPRPCGLLPRRRLHGAGRLLRARPRDRGGVGKAARFSVLAAASRRGLPAVQRF